MKLKTLFASQVYLFPPAQRKKGWFLKRLVFKKKSQFFEKDLFFYKERFKEKDQFFRKMTAPLIRWKMISKVLFCNGKVVLRVGKYQNFRLRRAEGVTTL